MRQYRPALEKEPPITLHTYILKNIACKIFNYPQTLLGLASFMAINLNLSHLYHLCDHVINGDLSVISTSKLRDLTTKVPKYRKSCKVDWDKIYQLCVRLWTCMHLDT